MPVSNLLSKAEIESLYSAANSAIWHSHYCAGSSGWVSAREENYVATLINTSVTLLAKRWSTILEPRGIAARVSGVFSHGHPRVNFASAKTAIELADLLIVHQHCTEQRTTARAILVQAKMASDATHRLSGSDDQLVLFSTWLPFEFVSGGLANGFRDIKEKAFDFETLG